LPKSEAVLMARVLRACFLSLLTGLAAVIALAQNNSDGGYFAPRNTFGILTAFSGDSSHMLLGTAENRKLLSMGVSYNRRLVLNRIVNWQYSGELLPVALESDPVLRITQNWTSPYVLTESYSSVPPIHCTPGTGTYSFTATSGTVYSFNYADTCGRQWTIGQAFSPVGMQWNFQPRHKLQFFLNGHGGYMYTTQPIPVSSAGSFNFTFDLGGGVEFFRSHNHSVRAEYRYHHISNHETASTNPGIDNGLVQIAYTFGR